MLAGVIADIRSETRILLRPDGSAPYEGVVGGYRYWFEGEDDLLHLAIHRADGQPITVEEAQSVVSFVVPSVNPGVIWLKQGVLSQHFYFGHDELLL